MPAWQFTVAPSLTFGRPEQSCPHVPQFLASVLRLTHNVPHMSAVAPVQLAVHFGEPDVEEQTGVAAGQTVVQFPQVFESVRFDSHPSSGRAEQWANPAAHAAVGTMHTPA
jgi:hypothetical protein